MAMYTVSIASGDLAELAGILQVLSDASDAKPATSGKSETAKADPPAEKKTRGRKKKEEAKEEAKEDATPSVTFEAVVDVAKKVIGKLGREGIAEIMGTFNVSKMGELEEGQYADFQVACEDALSSDDDLLS